MSNKFTLQHVESACGLFQTGWRNLLRKAFELGRCVHSNPSGPSVLGFALTEGIRYGSTLTGRTHGIFPASGSEFEACFMLHVRLDLSRSFVGCLNSFRSGHPKRYGTRPEIRKKRGAWGLERSL